MRMLICKQLSRLDGEGRGERGNLGFDSSIFNSDGDRFHRMHRPSPRRYTVVMTRGSAATFYAPRAYVSDDIDFVITLKGTGGEDALKQLGFQMWHLA